MIYQRLPHLLGITHNIEENNIDQLSVLVYVPSLHLESPYAVRKERVSDFTSKTTPTPWTVPLQ
ncbi:KR domain-containing protein [Pseudomonas phage SRT6]|nr:KR domain-containing protein [Pseudomonas phage SRT6]